MEAETRTQLGLDSKVRELEAEKAAIDKSRREAKPVETRLDKARAYERRLQDEVGTAERKGEDLAERKRLLDKEFREHDERMAALRSRLDEARTEVAGVLAELAKEKGAGGQASAAVAAGAVAAFFDSLAPQVAQHPEGQARVGTIRSMLDELLRASVAAAAAESPGLAEPAGPVPAAPPPPARASAAAAAAEERHDTGRGDDDEAALMEEDIDELFEDQAARDRVRAALQSKAKRVKKGTVKKA